MLAERYLYGLSNLVGEVGGSMGLFLGVSLVTLFEAASGAAERAFAGVGGAKMSRKWEISPLQTR